MAESNHDDLADALARLAGGDVAPSEREHEPAPPPPMPPSTAKPTFRPTPPGIRPPAQAGNPPAPRPPALKASTPHAPAPVRPVAPVVAAPAASRPQRPAVPSARPAVPLHPNLTPPQEASNDPGAETDAQAEFDDDAVIVPAPDASVFVPRKKPTTTAEARARVARRKQLDFRRTLIPVLLTTGALTVAFGLAPKFLGPDSVAGALPAWVTPTLVGTGGILLALAAVNMASVRSMLLDDARLAAPAAR